jgi:hypothetical protein
LSSTIEDKLSDSLSNKTCAEGGGCLHLTVEHHVHDNPHLANLVCCAGSGDCRLQLGLFGVALAWNAVQVTSLGLIVICCVLHTRSQPANT